MASVRFSLKRKTGNLTSIRATVHHLGARQIFSTGIRIHPGQWDAKRQKIKIPSNPAYENQLNAQLQEFRLALIQTSSTANSPVQLGARSIYLAITDHKKRMIAAGCSNMSLKSFSTLASKLALFSPGDIRIAAIDQRFIQEFAAWLNLRNYTNSHTRKMVRLLQTILGHENPQGNWRGVKLPPDKYRDEIYLTPQEIEMLRKADLKPSLQRVRDLFLVGCYTGLRFSDLGQVNSKRVIIINGTPVLRIDTQKTKHIVTLPVSQALADILRRYPDGIPLISNQKMNKYLKILAELAGLTQMVEVTEYRAGQPVRLQFRKCDLIYTHTARRSFATNGVIAGIPIPEMMKFTGHKSLSSFIRYIRTSNDDAALLYSTHAFFSGSSS